MQKQALLLSILAVAGVAQAENRTTNSSLDELVVTASRVEQPLRQVAVSLTVLDANTLELKGYQSLADQLRSEPGISVSNSGGQGQVTALRIRGEEQYRTLLLVDGMDVSDPSATQQGPLLENFVAGDEFQRIEILRGPQGFAYGADAGGVVNLITRDGSEGLSARIRAEAGANDTRNLSGTVTAGDPGLNLLVNLARFETEGFNSRQSDIELADNDGSENTSLHFKGFWQAGENLGATLVYRQTNLEYDYDGCWSLSFTVENDCSGSNDQQNLKITLDHDLGRFQQSLAYALTDIERSTYTFDDLTYATEGSIDAVYYLGQLDVSDSQRWIIGSDLRSYEMSTSYGDQGGRDQVGVYSEYQWQPLEQLYLTAGLRFDDHDDYGSNTSGRVSAAWLQENDEWTLKYRATYGTGFRAPSLWELAYNAGPYQFGSQLGVNLQEENSRGYDLGMDLSFQSGLTLQLTWFDQRVEDEIYYEFDTLTYFDGYRQDQGESQSQGVELALSWPLMEQLVLQASATYNETEDSAGQQRVRRPRNMGSVSLHWTSADQRLNVLLSARYSHDAVDIYDVVLDDYEVIDLSLNYQVNDWLQLFGRAENLADEDYVEVSGYNSQDRSAYAGLRVSF